MVEKLNQKHTSDEAQTSAPSIRIYIDSNLKAKAQVSS